MSAKLINPLAGLIGLCLLGLLVFLSNVFALTVIFSRRGERRKSIPLIWLLVANALIGGLTLPTYGVKKYGGSVCDAWRFLYFSTTHMTLVSLLCMTFDQILFIKFPIRYPTMATKTTCNVVLSVCFLFILAFDALPLFPFDRVDEEGCRYKVRFTWAIVMNVSTVIVPLPVLLVSYSYMLYVCRIHNRHIRRNTVPNDDDRHRRSDGNHHQANNSKVSKRFAYVVGSYILCWSPQSVYYVLNQACRHQCFPDRHTSQHHEWIRFFFKLLPMFHGFVTPVVFCWKKRVFRKDTLTFLRSSAVGRRLFLRKKNIEGRLADVLR